MKKTLATIALLLMANLIQAQQKGQPVDSTLRVKNRPIPSTTSAPQIQDAKAKSDREMEAEINTKKKGTIQKQTEVDPDEIIPPAKDTIRIQPRIP